MANFHPFVFPFVFGTVALFVICGYKYVRWIKQFDEEQKRVIRKNIFSTKILPAIWEMFCECLLHLRISKKNRRLGYMHRSIAFGWFLLIVFGAVESRLGIKGPFHFWCAIFYRFFHHNPPANSTEFFFTQLMDLLLLYVLSGLFLALLKKIHSRILGMRRTTRHTKMDIACKVSLWAIFPLRLLSESVTARLYGNGGFLTQTIGDLFGRNAATFLEMPLWSLYSLALCIFFLMFPFTRYMHIFAEVFLIYFRKIGVREGEKLSGYTKYELSACSRCGMCIDGCPLYNELDINDVQSVYLLRNMRNLEHKMDLEKAAANCLMCHRCAEDCPVDLDLMNIRRISRDKGDLDFSDGYRYLDKVSGFNAVGRVVYFGGCMSQLTPSITAAMKEVFNAAGQKYWHIDENRSICCGRPLLQQGFNNQAASLRAENTRLIAESHAVALVTSCPICYHSFKDEYDLPIPVYHHTEYIDMLMKSGRLSTDKCNESFTYHDPCELGRGSGIYKQPRDILSAIGELRQIAKERDESLCCGMNLGNTVLTKDEQTRLRDAALSVLTEPAPDVVVTACPMCKKAFNHGTKVNVKDIAEIVAENLNHTK